MSKAQKAKKPVNRGVKVSIPTLRKQLTAFLAGYRKHPNVLRGIHGILGEREARADQRKLDTFEARDEKLERELAKVRRERNAFAAQATKRTAKSRKIARAVLPRQDAKDFLG